MSKKQKIILATGIALAACVVFIIIGAVFAAAGTAPPERGIEVQPMDEASGEYLLLGVPKNYSFKIKAAEGESFAVTDIKGNPVETKAEFKNGTVKIKAPDGGYEEGELYSLDLQGRGTFEDENYKYAAKVVFCIGRQEDSNITYKENVKKVEIKDVEILENQATVKGEYKEGDIISFLKGENESAEFYKLSDVTTANGVTTANISTPAAEEVYEDIDIFYYGNVNLKDAEIDEEKFKGTLNETGILDAFVDKAYALKDFEIEVTKQFKGRKGYRFTAVIEDPSDRNRQLEITFGIKDRALIKCDDDVLVFDNTLTATSSLEFTVKGEGKKETEEKIKAAIATYAQENENGSKGTQEVILIPIRIPVFWGIEAYVNAGLKTEVQYAAEFNAGVEAESNLRQGIMFDTEEKEIIKIYGDITGDIDGHIMAKGKLEAFAGAFIEAGLKVPLIIEVGLNATGGPYLSAEGCFTIEGIPENISAEGYYKSELGLLFKADAKLKIVFLDEKTLNLTTIKKPLCENSNYLNLEGVNLKDVYYNAGGKVNIGTPQATYKNRINGQYETYSIEDFLLSVDGKGVEVTDGDFPFTAKNGKHNLFLVWTYQGNSYQWEKETEISGKIDYVSLFGKTREEIEAEYGPLVKHGEVITVEEDYGGDMEFTTPQWYYLEALDIRLVLNGGRVTTVSGTAEQFFDIKEGGMSYDEFSRTNGIEPHPPALGDKYIYTTNNEYIFYDLAGLTRKELEKEKVKYHGYFGIKDCSWEKNHLSIEVAMKDDSYYAYPDTIFSMSKSPGSFQELQEITNMMNGNINF